MNARNRAGVRATRGRRAGVTLIEVLVAGGIFVLILAAGYSLWSAVRRAIASGEAAIDARESALLAFSRIREELEDALVLQTGEGGRLVLFASPFHGGGFEFDPGRSELHQLLRGGRRNSKVHVQGLKDVSFQAFPGGILRIELTLERRVPAGRTVASQPVTFVDELHVPGLARRGLPSGAAWNSPRQVPPAGERDGP